METMYTPEEVAEQLKLNPETIRRMLRENRLKGHLFGRVWRIPQSSVDTWLRETGNKGPSAPPEREERTA
jgi:excisionase family DNA binding protein